MDKQEDFTKTVARISLCSVFIRCWKKDAMTHSIKCFWGLSGKLTPPLSTFEKQGPIIFKRDLNLIRSLIKPKSILQHYLVFFEEIKNLVINEYCSSFLEKKGKDMILDFDMMLTRAFELGGWRLRGLQPP